MARTVVVAVALAFLLTPALGAQGIDVVGLIDTYYRGRYDEAVNNAAALPDLGPFRLRFVQDTPGWIAADPAKSEARRAAVAAFLVELTAVRLESDWGRLSDLIELMCVQLRAAGPPTEFERAWHAASHALAGRARDQEWLLGLSARLPHQPPNTPRKLQPNEPLPAMHLLHALERFPDDPRFQLSRVIAWTWGRDNEPIRNVRRRDDDDRPRRGAPRLEALVTLEPLTLKPEVAAEAWIRIGLVQFSINDFAAALRAFEAAQPIATEPAMNYLAHFNAARALERLSRPDDAMREYRKALDIVPDAESGTIALASLQFMRDERASAVSQIERVFNHTVSTTDPGRLMGYGSFIHWPALKASLRAAVSAYSPGAK